MTTSTSLVGFGFTDPTSVPDTTTFAANFAKVQDTLCQIELVMEGDLAKSTKDIATNTQNIANQLDDIKGGLGYMIKGLEGIENKLCELHEIRTSIDELNTTIYKFCKLLVHTNTQSCK